MSVTYLDHVSCVFTIPGVLTPEECKKEIALVEEVGFTDAPITTWLGPVMRPDVRNNTRVMLDDFERAERLWQRIKDVVPATREGWNAVGLNERFRYYRYEPGQAFRWHRDGCYARRPGERSMLTLMVYLNDGFLGGRTQFDMLGDVVPEAGMALVFDHPLLHQGEEVFDGLKYVLRTDVMYRDPKGS